MNIDTSLMEQARDALSSVEIPDPPAPYSYRGTKYHEVLGPLGEPLLVSFGLVPLADWLELVNDYYENAPAEAGLGDKPWDAEDADKVVAALDRLHYERVSVVLHEESQETPFTIQWGIEGIVPVTVWVIDFEARSED